VVSAAPASAATPTFNLTTSPLPVELTTTPGSTVTTGLRVENSGTTPIKIKVSLLKFKSAGSDGKPLLLKRQPGDTFFDWVTFSQNDFTAQPGVWNTIQMTINPPREAAFGYYYAVVFSQDNTGQSPTTPDTSRLNGATATLVLLNVQTPGEKRQLSVTSFSADKKVYEYLPVTFSIKVHNGGNIFTAPTGNIYISRDHKHNIAILDVNDAQGNILSGSNRIFQAAWSDGFPVFTTQRDHGQIISDKQGQPVEQLQWNFSKADKLRFGHYYAHLLLVYNDGKQDVPIDAEVSFWVVPWKAIIGFVLCLIGLYGLHRWSVRRAVRRHRQRNLSNKTDREKPHAS
jgi:hypothetical protein